MNDYRSDFETLGVSVWIEDAGSDYSVMASGIEDRPVLMACHLPLYEARCLIDGMDAMYDIIARKEDDRC